MTRIHEKIAAKQGVVAKFNQKVETLEQTIESYGHALERHKADRDRTQAQVDTMLAIAKEAEEAQLEIEEVKKAIAARNKVLMATWTIDMPGVDEDPEMKALFQKRDSLQAVVDGVERRINTVYYGKAGL